MLYVNACFQMEYVESTNGLIVGTHRIHVSITGKSITVNLDRMCLDNQSHHSIDVIEFLSVV